MKQLIDYDELKDGFSKMDPKKSRSIGMLTVAFDGVLGGRKSIIPKQYPYGESILIELLGAAVKKIVEQFFSVPVDFSEDDLKNIEHLINEGRRQGLKEMEIRISRDLGAKIELSAHLPGDKAPIGTSINLNRKNNGDYVIQVRFEAVSHLQDAELEKYHQLRQGGILSQEEFEQKKREILRA